MCLKVEKKSCVTLPVALHSRIDVKMIQVEFGAVGMSNWKKKKRKVIKKNLTEYITRSLISSNKMFSIFYAKQVKT